MTEPITIDGKQYEKDPNWITDVDGRILLKPLPKQPEAEKRWRYIVQIYTFDTPVAKTDELFEYYHWTPQQAQLAADAVRSVLEYIQGEEKYPDTTHKALDVARDAMKDSE